MKEILIGKTKVGGDNPCFVTAEIGINFDGKYEQALKLIDVAADARCNAVKFQLFSATKMYAKNAGKHKNAKGEYDDIIEVVKKGELPVDWIPQLKKYAEEKGLEFFSTVCDEEKADVLEKYGVSAFKIASYEITHIPLLRHVARKKKPIIFSCGGAEIKEISEALDVFKEEGNNEIALLHCVAQYGAELESLNLGIITTLKSAFPDIIIGYSDHSSDSIVAPKTAVALGAKIIEKHITLDRNLPGPDHSFALNPDELKLMVKTIRKTEEKIKKGEEIEIDSKILGSSERKTFEQEKDREFTYRCVFAKKNIKKGDLFSQNNIAVLRPGENKRGLEPKYYELLIRGYRATRDIAENKSLTWDDVLLK